VNRVTAAAQQSRAFEAAWARSHDEKRILAGAGRHGFWVPTFAPLLTHGGVLRTSYRCHGVVTGHAHVAADAFADVIDVSVLDPVRQELIRDRERLPPYASVR
jgi:hypothetical protein